MFNYFKKSLLILLSIGILPSAYAMGITTFASILSPFSYLYNKLHEYNYTLEGSFCRIFETGKFTPENLEIIQKYFAKGYNSNILIGKNKKTPLIFTIEHQNLDMIKLLIDEYKVEVNIADAYGNTPLSTAVKIDNFEIAKYLLQHEADPNYKANGNFPLVLAVKHQNLDMIALLLTHKADINAYNCGDTPLVNAIETGNSHIVEYLLQHKANPNSGGHIPLVLAVKHQNLDLIKLLLQNKADINIFDYWDTPLSMAVETDNLHIVEYLLQHEADPNIKLGRYVKKPLIVAVERKNLDMVKLLIQYKADINNTHGYWETPLSAAVSGGNQEIATFLLEHGANPTTKDKALIFALYCSNLDMLKLLLQNKADINYVDDINGHTPLCTAIEMHNLEAITFLCNAGASLTNIKKRHNSSAFYVAVDSNCTMDILKKDIETLITYVCFDNLPRIALETLLILKKQYPETYKDLHDLFLLKFSELNNIDNLANFKKKIGKELSILTSKDPLLAQVYKRIRRLKKILKMKNNKNQTALDLLHSRADNYSGTLELIQELEKLLDGTKLDDDFKQLETALAHIKASANKLTHSELISELNSKLPNNLALEIYKNCAYLEHEKN